MSKRVLIIEDEPNIAVALRFLLDREGLEVRVVQDGAAALETITDAPPDLVILDVMLPNRSGFDILRDIRQSEHAALPVLMLTAKGQPRDRQTAEELGVNAFLTKPFSNAEVVKTVHELIDA